MIEALFKIASTALSIWDSKEKTKYVDAVIKLEKEYYEENNKDRPDMAVINNIELELFVISKNLNSQIKR